MPRDDRSSRTAYLHGEEYVPIPIVLLRTRTGIRADRALRVYGVLARYANHEGEAWPRRARIAAETELSEKAVSAMLTHLESEGWIERRRAGKGKMRVGNVYRIITPAERDARRANELRSDVRVNGTSGRVLTSG